MGSIHPRPAWLLTTRGRIRAAAGRWTDAERDLRRAMAVLEQANATPTEFDGATVALLAQVVEHGGNIPESTELYDRAAKILRSNPTRSVYGVISAYTTLADHYRTIGKPEDEAYFRGLVR